ncbi:Tegument antigen [Clonorchis sinensis]|uniref:Tegument antigen n=2 Tax=Clonorchis sinensis TaxID=79923 RepID=G7YAJ8_CLOSI|nr:Tegument antigen [Clonorchis sinensis]GAA49982.1 tegument antigen [Clonorchis sinensis]
MGECRKNGASMDDFLVLFFKIDRDYDEVITTKDLEMYAEEHHLDPIMVKRWSKLFDADEDGNITLERFCDVLGLRVHEVLNERRSTIATKEGQFRLGPDVEELASSMPLGSRINISNEARALMKDPEGLSMSEVARRLKVHLDEHYERCWQVVITKGSFWMHFSHVAESSFQFRLFDYIFLIWRTPADI